MSEDTTTTSTPAADTGATEQVAQPAPAEPVEADVSAPAQTTEQPETPSTEKKDDFDANKWAETKGLNLNNPEDVAKMVKSYSEAEKKMHQSSQQASELKGVIDEEVAKIGVPEDDVLALQQRMQVIEAERAVENFYAQNPDARQYDAKMAQIARDKGIGDIDALYAMAKVEALNNGGAEALKDEGKKEGLQDLALKQKVASATSSATTKQMATPEVTREDVQRALASGDVTWLRNNKAAIDAL